MKEKIKAVIDTIIASIEKQEKATKAAMEMKDEARYIPNDRFMAGWVSGVSIGWEHSKCPDRAEEYKRFSLHFEFNGISVFVSEKGEKEPEADLTFLTSKIFKDEIVPALYEWAKNKVDQETFGGFYDAKFRISITLQTTREVREDDQPHMLGRSWEQDFITVSDETRIQNRRKMIHQFILNLEYEQEDIATIDNSLLNISTHAVKDFFEDFGAEKLAAMFAVFMEKVNQQEHQISKMDLMLAFAEGAANLTDIRGGRVPAPEELTLACKLCMLILLNTTEQYERQWGQTYLKSAAELGSKEAKMILKYGTGMIPAEILTYRDKLVNCSANDIEKVVDLKIKAECPEAYILMVEYLTRIIKNGFPGEYKIKFNSKVKNFVNTSVKSTKINNFFANAAQYPEVYPALREYFSTAFDDYNYYSDATDEEAVNCGGYAAMSLAFANPEENFDVALSFLEKADFEHALTARYFAQDFAAICGKKNAAKVNQIIKNYC